MLAATTAFAPLVLEVAAAATLAQAAQVAPVQVQQVQDRTAAHWQREIIPALQEYVQIPNVSEAYNPQWRTDGHMDSALRLATTWVERQGLRDANVHVSRLGGFAPVIVVEIPGSGDKTVLMYGHLDKQPGMDDKWRAGLGPWKPVIEGDRLYGRGSSDDGYAIFSSVSAIKALQDAGIPHPKTVILIEFSEESGSIGLPEHLAEARVAEMIGTPDLVICLDSEVKTYDAIGLSTSLRGLLGGVLRVETLSDAAHSGRVGGVAVDPFFLAVFLMERLGKLSTQQVLRNELYVDIPSRRVEEARALANVLGASILANFHALEGVRLLTHDPVSALLAGTWSPSMTVTGIDGIPTIANAGNVIQAEVGLNVSVRIPPTLDPKKALDFLTKLLTENPPYRARVSFTDGIALPGWHSPVLSDDLTALVLAASMAFYGNPYVASGVGGSIPFMGMLGEKFPDAQFVITGVLGPESNAHGPNEFLHLPYAQRLTAAVALILAGMR